MRWDLFGTSANTATADANGCRWTVASSDGWDAPDQRTQFASPSGRHGQYGFNRFADGRPVVIKGLVFAPSQDAAWLAYDKITSAMPGLTGSGVITAYEPVPKSLTVSQAGPPRVSKPAENGIITYWLTLVAEYPWKRATTPVTFTISPGATAMFTDAGTFAAEIQVTTTSAGTVQLSASGQTLRTSTLPSGSVLTSGPGFTNPERTVRGPSGADLFSATLSPMQWPAVSPGDNSFVNSGTANLSVTYYPTYA